MDELPPTPESPPPSRISRLLRTVLSPIFQRFCLAVFLSLAVAALLIEYGRTPDVNLKVGDIADHNIRATRNYELVDEDATRNRRDLAEHQVRPVFDHDLNAASGIVRRVKEAFRAGRDWSRAVPPGPAAEEVPKDLPPASGAANRVAKAGGSSGEEAPVRGSRASSGMEPPGVPSSSLSDRRPEFMRLLGVEIQDVFFENLEFLRFAPSVEEAIGAILEELLKAPVIMDRVSLPDDMSAHGISVLGLGSDTPGDRLVFDRDLILDMSDVRRRVSELVQQRYQELPQYERDTLIEVASRLVQPTLSYNASLTSNRRQQARSGVQPVVYHIKKGTMIVRAGDPIDAQKLLFIRSIARAKASYHAGWMFLSLAFQNLILLIVCYTFSATYVRKVSTAPRDLAALSLLLIFVIALVRASVEVSNALAVHLPVIPAAGYYFAIPIASGAMVVRILMNSETALVFSVIISAISAMVVDYSLFFFSYFLISSLAAAGGIAHTRERVHVLRGGLTASVCNILGVLAIFFVQANMLDGRMESDPTHLPYHVISAFLGGMIAAIISLGIVPFFEILGYVTDYKLLEMASLNHPLLKELMVRAPGTYHHSVIVGTLSESAAQSIRANALLARVGCYYHDIGKMRKPEYFIENLRNVNDNRHDHLPAQMSALIVASHVRDGIEMARQHRLPPALIDLIPQHHGTSLIGFFFNKARQNATDGLPISETDFRYPGPKPQTREAGIVMLADATEASTRSIKQVNPAKIRSNLQKIFQRIISDGQLDECPLTLKDLGIILENFHTTLLGIYHNRIEYPAEFSQAASIAGQGTGAVILQETEFDGSIRKTGPGQVPRAEGPSGELLTTTTADPVPVTGPAPPPSAKGAPDGMEVTRDTPPPEPTPD